MTTTTLRAAADEFLAQHTIAVAGVSRDEHQPANLIYRRLREHGYRVYAVNPHAATVEGDRCYPDVASLPEPVDGLVVATPPEASADTVLACADAGIPRVWLHRGLGPGSLTDEAVEAGRERGLSVIPGGCPNMFGVTADPAHKCMRSLLQISGKVPRKVEQPV